LTACTGTKTKILLYVAASKKLTCNNRMKLRYADTCDLASIHKSLEHCEPQGFIGPNDYKGPGFLCKFRDVLTAEQMQDDLVFTVSDNQKPYRERVYMWW